MQEPLTLPPQEAKDEKQEASCKIEIEITQDDIDNGLRGKAESCMIARAIRRTIGISDDEIMVYFGCSGYYAQINKCMFHLPGWVQDLIVKFDNDKGLEIKPFKIVLENPEKAI